ncbi:MAG TPA: DUF4349 domain-containing protein [Planctomycetota bacterium]|nr:DUF4349 domain-containing protein [Planctomycetota bacterium]
MSHADHEWAKEQIAAHLAGGLNAEERARLEAHAATCAECIAELDAGRRFERQMDDLFAPVRATAGMEERIIQKLRFTPLRKQRSLAAKLIFAAAAVVMMGVLGYVLIEVDQGHNLFPLTETVAVQEARMSDTAMLRYDRDAVDPNSGRGASTPGSLTGARFKAESPDRLASADEMARQRERLDDAVIGNVYSGGMLNRAELGDRRRGIVEYDHKGSDDAVTFGLGLGGGKGGALRAAAPPQEPLMATPAAPPPGAGPSGATGMNALALQQEAQKNVYSYRSDAPAQKPADAERFNPAEAKQLLAREQLRGDLAKADEKTGKDLKAGELAAKRQQGANAGADKAGQGQPKDGQEAAKPQQPEPPQRKVIRTGEVEYEIESFDTSVGTISKLVEEEAGYVATVNSDKLPNGKVRGVVVIRIPPERLDTLLLKLRGLGELKSQNIRSQDVGKQYYDLESRLKAARTMEERLLRIIKEGKGEIKDLLLAEKELGEWRTKIETFEGEKRYYDSQISLSSLTVTLSEKEIRSASAVTETERVDTGIEVEDVEKAYKAALAAVAEAKGRVTKSDLKQLAAGQYSAQINFEVAPDAAGPLRDRLKQLGTVARLDITRVQETEGGIRVLEALKVRLKDTQFQVSIYNLANVTPRETVTLSLACADAEASYKQILARIEKAGGRMVTSSLNRQKNDQTTGTLRFEVKTAEADALLLDIRTAGDVMRLDVLENPDTQAVTKSKKGFQVQLFAMGLVEPRETTTLTIGSKDVAAAYRALQDALAGVDARIFTAQLNENDRQNVNATIAFDYRRESDAKISAALAAAGDVLTRSSSRSQDTERVIDTKKRLNVTLVNVATISPRETYTLAVVVDQVDAAVNALETLASDFKGRIIDSRHTRGAGGNNVSNLTLDFPLAVTRGAADKIKSLGLLRIFDTARNVQAPEGDLATGRIVVTLSNASQLVDAESGPWMRIKSGLSVGLTALSWSLTLVIVGLCFVVPLGLLGWVGLRLYRRTKAKPA